MRRQLLEQKESKSAREEEIDFYKTTKIDLFLIVLIIVLSCASILWISRGHSQDNSNSKRAVVYRQKSVLEEFDLEEDKTINFSDPVMKMEIKGTKIRVTESDCPGQICVNIGWIQYSGQTIVCVPNKILIEMKSSGSRLLDAVVY